MAKIRIKSEKLTSFGGILATGQLLPNNEYDFDFGHQFIETEKFDAKMTYKKFTGYSPGIATVVMSSSG